MKSNSRMLSSSISAATKRTPYGPGAASVHVGLPVFRASRPEAVPSESGAFRMELGFAGAAFGIVTVSPEGRLGSYAPPGMSKTTSFCVVLMIRTAAPSILASPPGSVASTDSTRSAAKPSSRIARKPSTPKCASVCPATPSLRLAGTIVLSGPSLNIATFRPLGEKSIANAPTTW